MKPQLGWVWLSQAERLGAEAALDKVTIEGARDELGFSRIHFGYADRFFPGTSVQHTKLRYLYFIGWAYQEALSRYPGAVWPDAQLSAIQDRTGRKLIRKYGSGDNTNILGVRILRGDGSPQTKPSRVYWNALRMWGLLASDPTLGEPPSQSWIHSRWGLYSRPLKRPEVDATKVPQPLFSNLPPVPANWKGEGGLEFDLTVEEAALIRSGWKRAAPQEPLMSRLAATRGPAPSRMTARAVLALCSKAEVNSLKTATQAASLVCIGRALYAAMVDDLKAQDRQAMNGGQTPSASQSSGLGGAYLKDLLKHHQEPALRLDIDALALDVAASKELRDFLVLIQDWARTGGSYAGLVSRFQFREEDLKDGRALLIPGNAKRRQDWSLHRASPLNYRWNKVSAFLDELAVR